MNKKTYKQIGIFILINILAIAYASCYSLKRVPCLENGSPCELESGQPGGMITNVVGFRFLCRDRGPGRRDCNATGTTNECSYSCIRYYNGNIAEMEDDIYTTVDSATLSGEECTYQQ